LLGTTHESRYRFCLVSTLSLKHRFVEYQRREVSDLSNIRSQFTNIKGERAEYSRITFKFENRHFLRESESTLSQLRSVHRHGRRKDYKTPIDKRLH